MSDRVELDWRIVRALSRWLGAERRRWDSHKTASHHIRCDVLCERGSYRLCAVSACAMVLVGHRVTHDNPAELASAASRYVAYIPCDAIDRAGARVSGACLIRSVTPTIVIRHSNGAESESDALPALDTYPRWRAIEQVVTRPRDPAHDADINPRLLRDAIECVRACIDPALLGGRHYRATMHIMTDRVTVTHRHDGRMVHAIVMGMLRQAG